MVRLRHAGGIGVPVEQVEGQRFLAAQVVVDEIGPDQIARAQEVEGRRHLRAFQIALLLHRPLQRLELRLVDENLQITGMGEIDLGGQEGGRGDPRVAGRLQIGEGGAEQRAADAIADRVDLFLIGGRLDRVEAEDDAFLDIGLPVLHRLPVVGIDPGDDEDRVALADQPVDEGFLRLQVENVELVDPGRNDQQRPLEHGLGLRRVLDDLADVVLGDHLARGQRHVAADLEGRGVRLAQAQGAAAGLHVLGEHLHAAHQVLAVGGDGLAVELGIGQDEIRGRQGVAHLPEIEFRLVARVRIEALGALQEIVGPARRQDVDLLHEVEEQVLAPLLVGKALVALGRLDRIDRRLAGHAPDRVVPDIHVVGEERGLGFHRPGRIGQPVFGHLRQGLDDLAQRHRIVLDDLAALARAHPGRGRLADLFQHMRHVAREGFRILDDEVRVGTGAVLRPGVVRLLGRRHAASSHAVRACWFPV